MVNGLTGPAEWLCNARQTGWYRGFPVPEADASGLYSFLRGLFMKKISITDMTLRRVTESGAMSFKERLEIAKCLDRLNVSAIELAPIGENKAESIFIKTLASVIRNTALALPVGLADNGPELAWDALHTAVRPRL